jgi:glycine dehydrogenase
MIQIREEMRKVEQGTWPKDDNPLKNAPHTAESLLKADWTHAYSREDAAFPVATLRRQKYWSPVGRVDNVYGDRNLFCSCIPTSELEA